MQKNDVIIPTQYGGIALFAQVEADEVTFSKQLAKPSPEDTAVLSLPTQDILDLVTGDNTWPVTRGNKTGSIKLDYTTTTVFIGAMRIVVTTEDFIDKMHYMLGLDQV